jgi:hypothetical protein
MENSKTNSANSAAQPEQDANNVTICRKAHPHNILRNLFGKKVSNVNQTFRPKTTTEILKESIHYEISQTKERNRSTPAHVF